MCPACVASASVMIASATSSGGLLACVLNKLRVRRRKTELNPGPKEKEK
jgi:hypothetical protein